VELVLAEPIVRELLGSAPMPARGDGKVDGKQVSVSVRRDLTTPAAPTAAAGADADGDGDGQPRGRSK
jgi:hypothetical protein